MRWRYKATLQQACSSMPAGPTMYRRLQRRFGLLSPDPFRTIPQHAAMVRRLGKLGFSVDGIRCLEIGTGHVPIAPVAFHLLGAREVVSVDLHRRLLTDLTSEMLRRLAAAEHRLLDLYEGLVAADVLRERLARIGRLASRPYDLLDEIGVHYAAPGDAARMPDPDGSYDLNFSMTVLEHIRPPALWELLAETRRLLRPDGYAAHLVDPSDHFARQDPTITKINFLRYSVREWERIAGNEFGYCNRLRASQVERMFTEAGLVVEEHVNTVDEPSRAALDSFPLHPDFWQFAPADLCTAELEVYARREGTDPAAPGAESAGSVMSPD